MGPISTALFSGGSSGANFSRAGPKARPTGSASRGNGIPVSSGRTGHSAGPTNSVSAFGSPLRPGTRGSHPSSSTKFNLHSHAESQPRGSEVESPKGPVYNA